jgi:hypothetical protein
MILRQMYSGGGLFILTIASNSALPNIPALATAAGWNGNSFLKVNITASLINRIDISSSWSFPSGLEIEISSGTRIGGNLDLGNAFTTALPVTVRNNGIISGAGGSGGSGGSATSYYSGTSSPGTASGGSGGGGQGFASAGSLSITGPGSGDAGAFIQYGGSVFGGETPPYAQGGQGGAGGTWGQAGASGGYGSVGGTYSYAFISEPGTGNPAGNSVVGNSLITWLATGSRLGAIS